MKKKNVENKPEGIILCHPAAMGATAFDFFARRGLTKKYLWVRESTYQMKECSYVKKWMREHKGYVYLGSEDLAHIPEFNAGVKDLVKRLVKCGFEMVYYFK